MSCSAGLAPRALLGASGPGREGSSPSCPLSVVFLSDPFQSSRSRGKSLGASKAPRPFPRGGGVRAPLKTSSGRKPRAERVRHSPSRAGLTWNDLEGDEQEPCETLRFGVRPGAGAGCGRAGAVRRRSDCPPRAVPRRAEFLKDPH